MAQSENWIIDHTGIGVSDIHRASRFYAAVLEPLGIKLLLRIKRDRTPADESESDLGGAAFGVDYPVFWLDVFHPYAVKQHTAFRARSRNQVQAFHSAGLANGGKDNGEPGLRLGGYPPGYYAAFLIDPDGNNIEAVYREI